MSASQGVATGKEIKYVNGRTLKTMCLLNYMLTFIYPWQCYSTSASRVRLSKQLKQIIQTEHNIVKNPNWSEANQLAIYKRGRGFELGATEEQIR